MRINDSNTPSNLWRELIMMRLPFGLVAFFVSLSAFAAGNSTKFQCETTQVIDRGNRPTKIEFAVRNLLKGKIDYSSSYDDNGRPAADGMPVKHVPTHSVLMLNDNYGIERTAKGDLKLTSDGDGCQWTTVVLYKAAGFAAGFARVKGSGGCGAGDYYSTLKCRVTAE